MIQKELLGYKICLYCERQNITKTALAERIGVRKQSLNSWIQGKCYPSLVNYEKLIKIIGEE